MQSDFLDRKLYKMAEQEQMAVSEDLDARVDDILQHLEKNGRGSRHHYSFRRGGILAGAPVVLLSGSCFGYSGGIRNVSGADGKHES